MEAPTTTREAERGTGDLTARARIRNAALRLFTEHGVRRTTIRAVAREAGVSSGLVQHHFGTKDALRAACDDMVLAHLVALKEELVVDGGLENAAFVADQHPEMVRWYRYLARSMIDGSPAAAALFDQMVGATEAWLATHVPDAVTDRRGCAVVLVGMETGLLAMHAQVSDALGVDVLSPEGHLRLARAKVDFYATPLLEPALAERARASLDTLLGGAAPPPPPHPRGAPRRTRPPRRAPARHRVGPDGDDRSDTDGGGPHDD